MTPTTINGEAGYVLTFEPEHMPAADAKIIFNCGSDASQTDSMILTDGNTYYRSGKVSGAEIVVEDATAEDAEYYDVLGRRVSQPANGFYIQRTGNSVAKKLAK